MNSSLARLPPRALLVLAAMFLLTSCPRIELEIIEVQPIDTATGISTSLTINGWGFEPGAGLHLTGSTGSTLTFDLDVDSSGEIATTMLPSGLAAGSYDLAVQNPGGEAHTLASGFSVYEGGLEIYFLDVGQGDATVIRSPRGDTLVKDAGTINTGLDVVIPFLSQRGALPPTHMITSHHHDDHMGGIVAILEGPDGVAGTNDDRIPSGLLLHNEPAFPCNSVTCNRYYAASRNHGRVAELGEMIDLGAGVQATVVAVSGRLAGGFTITPEDENSASIGIVVEFGDLRFFVGGDLTGGGFGTVDMETPLSSAIAPIHVLRVNHHGSSSSTNITFASNLSPSVAIISAGRDNPYCHPHRAVMTRLQTIGAKTFLVTPGIVYPTPDCPETTHMPAGTVVADGHIRLESSDGRRYTVEVFDGDSFEFVVP